jgi:hypothetical protein
MVQNRSHRPPAPLSQLVTNSGAASAPGRRYWLHLRPYPHQLPAPPLVQVAMRSAPSTRPSVSIACVASMYMHAAVASISEEAMPSAPVSDSWEGPKRRDATCDAIFGNRFFDSNARPYPPFSTLEEGGSENFFSETAATLCRAGPNGLWRRRHAESKPLRCACGGRGR